MATTGKAIGRAKPFGYTPDERKAVLEALATYEREVLDPAERREVARDPTFRPAPWLKPE